MQNKFAKLCSVVLVLVLSSLLFVGCFDVGEVEDEADYYSVFCDIVFLTENSYFSCDMEDFYNDEAVNDFACVIDEATYYYFAIQVGEDVTVGDIGFYVRASSTGAANHTVDAFIVNSVVLSEIAATHVVPNTIQPIVSGAVMRLSDKWQSVYIKKIGEVPEDNYILFRFNENALGSSSDAFQLTAIVAYVKTRG